MDVIIKQIHMDRKSSKCQPLVILITGMFLQISRSIINVRRAYPEIDGNSTSVNMRSMLWGRAFKTSQAFKPSGTEATAQRRAVTLISLYLNITIQKQSTTTTTTTTPITTHKEADSYRNSLLVPKTQINESTCTPPHKNETHYIIKHNSNVSAAYQINKACSIMSHASKHLE